mmetsp:Transcript_27922/g.59121  ORF Transcript_27922/g.59121 Transcript_27922/m.59121 type:complete len:230 (+) Transcript_27922:84-773(+)
MEIQTWMSQAGQVVVASPALPACGSFGGVEVEQLRLSGNKLVEELVDSIRSRMLGAPVRAHVATALGRYGEPTDRLVLANLSNDDRLSLAPRGPGLGRVAQLLLSAGAEGQGIASCEGRLVSISGSVQDGDGPGDLCLRFAQDPIGPSPEKLPLRLRALRWALPTPAADQVASFLVGAWDIPPDRELSVKVREGTLSTASRSPLMWWPLLLQDWALVDDGPAASAGEAS